LSAVSVVILLLGYDSLNLYQTVVFRT